MRRIPLRVYVLAAVMLTLLLLPAAVNAMDAQVRMYVDGQLIESDYEAALIDDIPYIPETFIQQQLGALAVWDDEKLTLALERGTYKAQFVLHERYAISDGNAVRLHAPPVALGDEIYVPAESVGELLGVKVTWDLVNYNLQFYIPKGLATESGGTGPTRSPIDEEQTYPNNPESTAADEAVDAEPIVQPDSSSGEQHTTDTDDVASASPNERSSVAVIGGIENSGDRIIIRADQALQAQIMLLDDPERLVIDLPNSAIGSLLNGQPAMMNGQVESTHPHIQGIRYAQFQHDPATVRIVIDLNQSVQYSLIQGEASNELVVDIRSRSYQVVLDAGHGGKDPGAITYSSLYEKDFALPLTLKVYERLKDETFIRPVLTRADDTFIELDERARIANDLDADLFLSIHGNTYIPSVHGTETYYYDAASKPFADLVHQAIVEATGFRDRNVRQQQYKVLRLAEMPAALIEVGYVSNKEQEALLYDDAFQDLVAQAIVDAIKTYLHLD